jgi:hypothetical protein
MCQPSPKLRWLKPWSVGQGVGMTSRPPGPTWPGVWATWSTCQIHPRCDAHFDIWSMSLYNPLKCSNLVPKFLKSNKHLNHGTRLVNKLNTWLFYTFTRYVGAWNRCFMSANSDYCSSFAHVSPCQCYGYLILLVWRIWFGWREWNLFGVMSTV